MEKLMKFCELKGAASPQRTLKPKIKMTEPEVQKDQTFFLSAPEISIFVACCVMVNELLGAERALRNGDISRSVFEEKSKAVLDRLTEAANATQRFDIILPVMERGRFSPFFWRWFNWWDDYLKELTPSQVAETERRARERGSLMDNLRPKDHWVKYRKIPAISFDRC
jgi:hypothetical protein